jgi:NAD(P)-dependent dehydrogenase (short-subunit alcohol dehydrogenase family)
MRTDDSVALVTGGTSGLGRASAERLHANGAQVVILDLPTAAGNEVAAALGKGTHSVHADVIDKFNMLRLAATSMAGNEPLDGDRGVCVLTASIAAFDGQIGQIPYAAAKAGIVGMTLLNGETIRLDGAMRMPPR